MAHDPKPHGRARGPTIPHSIQIMPVVPHPRLVAAACMDPTLAYMIENGLPLTREQWMSLNWPDGPPKPWYIEHEMEVPEFWQDPTKVEG
jgi:hypothetical protein